jgi:hypothetical protein
MGYLYRVAQGDCVANIAEQCRFANWRTIYFDPRNNDLRRKRPNPNILFPGDEIYIPDRDPGEKSAATDQKHTYVLKRQPVKIRLRIRDRNGVALGNKEYRLKIGDRTYEGRTDSDGLIEQEIAPTANQGELTVFFDEDQDDYEDCTWPLQLGAMDPIDEVSGIQGRLNNLGISCGAVDGITGPRTKAAIREFQSRVGLSVTGAIDDTLRAKLQSAHDNA